MRVCARVCGSRLKPVHIVMARWRKVYSRRRIRITGGARFHFGFFIEREIYTGRERERERNYADRERELRRAWENENSAEFAAVILNLFEVGEHFWLYEKFVELMIQKTIKNMPRRNKYILENISLNIFKFYILKCIIKFLQSRDNDKKKIRLS